MGKIREPRNFVRDERLRNVRPEFRRLINKFKTLKAITVLTRTTQESLSMAITRGGLSPLLARRVEEATGGEFKARLLVKEEKLDNE